MKYGGIYLVIAVVTITLRASWAHSLKDKRSIIKSLIAKIQNKFNVSVAETDQQDEHQLLVITVAAIAANHAQGDSVMNNILRFVEEGTEAEIIAVERDFR